MAVRGLHTAAWSNYTTSNVHRLATREPERPSSPNAHLYVRIESKVSQVTIMWQLAVFMSVEVSSVLRVLDVSDVSDIDTLDTG